MDYNEDKVDEMVLALLHLATRKDRYGTTRAWKSVDWEAMERLYEKGYISDPKGNARSVVMMEEGEKLSKALFKKHFGVEEA